jgi:hypothetical protein
MGPTSGLDVVTKRKVLPLQGQNPGRLIRNQLRYYTDSHAADATSLTH